MCHKWRWQPLCVELGRLGRGQANTATNMAQSRKQRKGVDREHREPEGRAADHSGKGDWSGTQGRCRAYFVACQPKSLVPDAVKNAYYEDT